MINEEIFKTEESSFFLADLMNTPSPSGYERHGGIESFKRFCREIEGAKEEFTDTMGNCAFSIGDDNAQVSIMLSGHIDEIGFQISGKTEAGLYTVVPLGGIDRKCLYGQQVEILASSGNIISGIIGKKPVHIEYYEEDEKEKTPKVRDILIDTGGKGEDEIQIGDPVVYGRNFNLVFGKDEEYILSKGLDDKIGVFISAIAFQELSKNIPEGVKIWCVANTQEEVGLRGAMRTAKRINPTYSIDFDVTFANDEGRGINEAEYGKVKLGGGTVIVHGPDKSEKLNRIMKNIGKDLGIPFQEVVSEPGSTNTSAIQEFSLNTETTILSIPLRNMHTPVELCSKKDIISTINMTVEMVKKLSK